MMPKLEPSSRPFFHEILKNCTLREAKDRPSFTELFQLIDAEKKNCGNNEVFVEPTNSNPGENLSEQNEYTNHIGLLVMEDKIRDFPNSTVAQGQTSYAPVIQFHQ